MKLILLSGGSGKRLWPLSNDSRSKQFLKVLRNGHGQRESMLQRVWSQLQAAGFGESIYVATGRAQAEIIQGQLNGNVQLIVEPERRDTFPAIALACSYLHSVARIDADETVCVLPVDSFTENRFYAGLKELERMIRQADSDILLVGARPDHPSEKYGYIVPDEQEWGQLPGGACLRVRTFVEKPHKKLAQTLFEQGALWNCGVFAFKLGYMISQLQLRSLPVRFEKLRTLYRMLPKTSFDYEMVEQTRRLAVYPYEGEWKDLGSWEALTEELDASVLGIGMLSKGCANTHVINELDIPVKIMDVSNIVVAASADGILVADKASSAKIKEMADDADRRLMYEERRWGWYRVLDYMRDCSGNERLTKKIIIHSGRNPSYQLHRNRKEVWTILSGQGVFAINDRLVGIGAGDVLEIPAGSGHSIKAMTELEMLEVQLGGELTDEDTTRLFLSWDDIERHCSAKK